MTNSEVGEVVDEIISICKKPLPYKEIRYVFKVRETQLGLSEFSILIDEIATIYKITTLFQQKCTLILNDIDTTNVNVKNSIEEFILVNKPKSIIYLNFYREEVR